MVNIGACHTRLGTGGTKAAVIYVRMIASFESIAGVFYLAVVLARLVAAYESTRAGRNEARAGHSAPGAQHLATWV